MDKWNILGIEKTKDKQMIQAAYRRKLVDVNPEDDAEGFMKLRKAYEGANDSYTYERKAQFCRSIKKYDEALRYIDMALNEKRGVMSCFR